MSLIQNELEGLSFFELLNSLGESVTEYDEDPDGNFEAMDIFSLIDALPEDKRRDGALFGLVQKQRRWVRQSRWGLFSLYGVEEVEGLEGMKGLGPLERRA